MRTSPRRYKEGKGAYPLCRLFVSLLLFIPACSGRMEAFPLTLSVGAPDDDSIEVHCPPSSLYGSYPGHDDDKWYERGERYTEMSVVVMDLRKDDDASSNGAPFPSSGWRGGDTGTGRNESLRDVVERYVKWFLKRDKYGSSKDDSSVKETLEYAYEENEETPSLLLEVRILEAGVTEVPSGMDESGGTLKASVRLHAGVRDMRKGAAIYEREFAAKEHLNVEEFNPSGREEAFNKAFCSVIASMRKELRKVSYGEAAGMAASAGALSGDAVKGSASVASVIEADYPDDVAFWDGALWVAERGDARKAGTAGTLLKIDPASMGVIAAIPAGKTPRRVVAGFGSLWVIGGEGGSVVRIDPRKNRVVREITVGGGVDCVAAGEGGVWAAGAIDNRSGEVTIVKIDPEDEEQTGRIRFAPLTTFTGITVYYGSLWALDGRLNSRSPGRVFRIDPRTNTVKTVIGVGEYSLGMASGEGSLWVVNAGRKRGSPGTVTRIDASTGKVIATIQAGIYPFAVTSGGGYVWVANMQDETVTKIDPVSNRVVDTIPVGKAPARIAFGHGSLWFTSLTDMTLNGVKP